jgi:hypothetical protein
MYVSYVQNCIFYLWRKIWSLHRSPDLQRTVSSIQVSPPSALLVFCSFYDVGFVACPFVWILIAGFKVLWMLGRIASLAQASNFQEGVPFIPFLQWFYDTKFCRPKLTQQHELVQIMTFNITVSSLELVHSGAMLPADSSVFEITATPPPHRVSILLFSGVRGSNPSPHTLL